MQIFCMFAKMKAERVVEGMGESSICKERKEYPFLGNTFVQAVDVVTVVKHCKMQLWSCNTRNDQCKICIGAEGGCWENLQKYP